MQNLSRNVIVFTKNDEHANRHINHERLTLSDEATIRQYNNGTFSGAHQSAFQVGDTDWVPYVIPDGLRFTEWHKYWVTDPRILYQGNYAKGDDNRVLIVAHTRRVGLTDGMKARILASYLAGEAGLFSTTTDVVNAALAGGTTAIQVLSVEHAMQEMLPFYALAEEVITHQQKHYAIISVLITSEFTFVEMARQSLD